MKTLMIVAATAMALTSATTAYAIDLPIEGLVLNTEVVAQYTVDAEAATLTSTPELAYSPAFVDGLTATAGIEIDIWNKADSFTVSDTFDVKPEILLGVTYNPDFFEALELEVATSYDFEAEARSEVTLTATFNF